MYGVIILICSATIMVNDGLIFLAIRIYMEIYIKKYDVFDMVL